MLTTILQAALEVAHSELSRTTPLIGHALVWVQDCFEWNQEAHQNRAQFQKKLPVQKLELDAINAELVNLRRRRSVAGPATAFRFLSRSKSKDS